MSKIRFSELTCFTRTAVALAMLTGVTMPQAQAAGVSGQGTWETTLQGRDLDGNAANGFEAYYDTALNITWLANANFAQTSGFDTDDRMNWDAAKAWAGNLIVGGTGGWRLPTLVDTGAPGCDFMMSGTDCGWNVNVNASELAHMYYVTLGNKAYFDPAGFTQAGYGVTNVGVFSNVQSLGYWSDVAYAPNPTKIAWYFGTDSGDQGTTFKTTEFYAWAVHDGDVAAVPEPSVYVLSLLGFCGLLLVRRGQR